MEDKPLEGESKVKRKMKSAYQLELLEKTYAVESYPSESIRAELSQKLGLSDRQLQMWFCHRRLKDRKYPMQQTRNDAEVAASSSGGAGDEMVNEHCSVSGSGSTLFGHNIEPKHRIIPQTTTGVALASISCDLPPIKRHYEAPQAGLEVRVIACVESQLGEPLRDDGPILGMEFDPLPPGAFGAPIATVEPKPATQPYEVNLHESPVAKPIRGALRAVHEYQFLPEQPSVREDTYERRAQSSYFSPPPHIPVARNALSSGRSIMHGNEQVLPRNSFQDQTPGLNNLLHQGHQDNGLPSNFEEFDNVPRKTSSNISVDAHVVNPLGGETSMLSLERKYTHDEEVARIEKKRKNEEARIAREVEVHEKRIRKELEKQDVLRRKREEQIRREMERQDRERRKEEERLLRERQREEERYQREQRREMERREKFMQKEIIRAERLRLKEDQRRERDEARLKAANDKATARKIAKDSMELIEDERLELMELAAKSKGFPSIVSLSFEDLHNLDFYKDKLVEFPPSSVCLERPFAIQPWTDSEDNVGNLLMVWRFLITFADLLSLWPFTLDEFFQSFHDHDSRLLGEIHIALLRSIIQDIEDVARTPSSGLGGNQTNASNPGGGHPQIVEGAYAWGFDIRSWQRHLNPLTWPEILRQCALSAGFGPKLKKKNNEQTHLRDENEGNDGADVISNLRSGVAAKNAVAIMEEKGFSKPRKSRHRLTPGTVKFAAFHVLSLEGSDGLTILEVADKIQRSGLRDLTTSKTPEASIAAALSRDIKLFQRTAPSTYCVRTPYRKDPVDVDAILSAAREKIQIFKNGFINEEEDAEDVEHDDLERDEDSESDVAEDPEVGNLTVKPKPENEADSSETNRNAKNLPADCEISSSKDTTKTPQIRNQTIIDQEDTVVDDWNSCESWVEGLLEGEYSDLSVEERLNALVALIGVANEGNSVRIVLEERMEAANALKKQMWAEAQLDKRRMKEEYVMKMQYTPFTSNRIETNGQGYFAENIIDPQNYLNYPGTRLVERNPEAHEFFAGSDNISPLQCEFVVERTRSQLKAYVGHKAEEMYVYRSLPLGQDRRRNRYWQFKSSASLNDPGSGRIYVELRNGFWSLIHTEEGFDSLVASLDVRGLRESYLHSMLQKVECSFKEALRRNLAHSSRSGVNLNNFKTENAVRSSNADISVGTSSTTSALSAFNYNVQENSSGFIIELGRKEAERKNLLNRYQNFEKWMWKECLDSSALCVVKYGKRRCKKLLGICDDCHNLHNIDTNHCPSCHRIYKTYIGGSSFSEHVAHCKELKGDVGLMLQGLNSSLPLRMRILKALFAELEVCIPAEALQRAWSEEFRKSLRAKLHDASSAEDLLQILTSLEIAIEKEFLSKDFETTVALLGFCNQSVSTPTVSKVSVLPWIPKTSSAVALRLMEFDSSMCYTPNQMDDLKKDQVAGNFITPPPKISVGRNIQEDVLTETPYEADNLQLDPWLDSQKLSSSSGRGRGSRGRGRGRGRVGRPPKKSLKSKPDFSPQTVSPTNKDGFVQLVGWKGRPRAPGAYKRGRPSIRSSQNREDSKSVVEVRNERDQNSMRNLVPVPQWGRDEMVHVEETSSSESERSEYDGYNNGQAVQDKYDDLAMADYNAGFSRKSQRLVDGVDYNVQGGEHDDLENDVDDEGLNIGEDDIDIDRYINGDSDDEGDGVVRKIGNPNDVTDSSSSEYSN